MTSCFPKGTRVSTDDRGAFALVEIDTTVYSDDVALRAAYWLSDRADVNLAKNEDGKLIAEVRLKNGSDGEPLHELCGEFCNELIDFALRARIASETQDVQAALLQRAFVSLVPKRADGG